MYSERLHELSLQISELIHQVQYSDELLYDQLYSTTLYNFYILLNIATI